MNNTLIALAAFVAGTLGKQIIIDTLKDMGVSNFSIIRGWKFINRLFPALFIALIIKLKLFPKEQAIATFASLFAIGILAIIANEAKKKTILNTSL